MEQSPTEHYDDITTGASQSGAAWNNAVTNEQDSESDNQNSPTGDNGEQSTRKVPMQKRRRVTRACDECRRKKIKCDGKQPCTHCTVYSYECTYDQPSNRRRNAQPQYIEGLETELKRAKAVIGALAPNLPIDLQDPDFEHKLQAALFSRIGHSNVHATSSISPRNSTGNAVTGEADSGRLESMVQATGNLDLDEQGYWDYHGGSSGLTFIRRMREQLGDIIGAEGQATPFVKTRPMSTVFESPKSVESPLDSSTPHHGLDIVELPSREEAHRLCQLAITDATAIIRCVHLPSFWKSFDRVYDTPHDNYSHDDHTFLPLLYAALAVGTLFAKNDGDLDKVGYENAIDKGFKYFQASRKLLDIAECRDLPSIQAVIYMILFLQSSAKLSTCYSYIGVAIRSALRLGLHRSFNSKFSCIEQELRKRIFWVIRKIDLYVGALIGLPYTLNDEDIDQGFPAEVDDEYITENEIRSFPPGKTSVMTAFNHHAKLMIIIGRVVRVIYPIKGTKSAENGLAGQNYTVSLTTIRDIEQQLEQWRGALPLGLRPGGDNNPIIFRCQHMLRLVYAHAQMMLYRPFLHYVCDQYRSKDVDPRAYACAVACVSVARNAIHIAVEMKSRHLLAGAYWSTMYTTYFSIMSLMFFVLQNPDDPTSHAVLKDAQAGKDTLSQLAKRSLAADRCSATLATVFDQLPEHLRKTRIPPLSQKKRPHQPRSNPASSSQPDLTVSTKDPVFKPRRVVALPQNYSNLSKTTHPYASHLAQQQIPLGMEYQNSPQLSNFDSTPGMTPSSTSSASFGRPLSQQFPGTPVNNNFMSNSDFGPPVTDMSALMFPSADPFAYPNQPMTTFENSNQPFGPTEPDLKNVSFMNTAGQSAMNNTLMNGSQNQLMFNENTSPQDDVQLFGTVPMYMLQHSSTHPQAFAQNPNPNPHQFPSTPTQSSPMSAKLAMDGPDFIGDEWSMPYMHQGTHQYGNADLAWDYQANDKV